MTKELEEAISRFDNLSVKINALLRFINEEGGKNPELDLRIAGSLQRAVLDLAEHSNECMDLVKKALQEKERENAKMYAVHQNTTMMAAEPNVLPRLPKSLRESIKPIVRKKK